MISPVVTIDVVPADAPAEYAPAMVTACSQGLPEGKCALARETSESTQATAVALVLWQGNQFLQVTVRVGRHGTEWVTRNLSFTEHDALLDRWTAVGLTVATLVGEGKSVADAPPTQPAPTPTPTPAPAPHGAKPDHPSTAVAVSVVAPKATPSPLALTAALGGLVGPGWRDANWQRGLWLSAIVGQRSKPWIVEGFASYAQSTGPQVANGGALESRWLSAGVGLGATGAVRALNLRFSAALELLFRHVSANLGSARGADNELPVRLRLLGAWPARGPLGAVLGAALRIPFTSANDGTAQAREPLLSGELQAGLELRL
ncbi:MAG: hypothetical protein ABJB12_16885 [Pseudomonadota bacterium]